MAQLANFIRLLTSPRSPQLGARRGSIFIVAVLLRLASAGLLVWVAAIHLHLWSEGYRHIPTVGPLFLADVVGGFALGAILLLWARPLVGVLGVGFMASTLAGLILSINFGLFGFRESSGTSFVVESIVLESVGTVVLLAWTGVVAANSTKALGRIGLRRDQNGRDERPHRNRDMERGTPIRGSG